MPRQSYNLPRLSAYANKVSNSTLEFEARTPTSSPSSPVHLNGEDVVLREPSVPSAASDSASVEDREWNDGLCDCSQHKTHCVLTTFLPCCMTCHEYKIHGEGCGAPLCFCMSLLPLTAKYRAEHHIRGALWKDCLLSLFCWQCQLCRLHRDFMACEKGKSDQEEKKIGEEEGVEAAPSPTGDAA